MYYSKKVLRLIVTGHDPWCVCCYTQTQLTFDHIIPVAKGGGNGLKNGQILCSLCNTMKADNIMPISFLKQIYIMNQNRGVPELVMTASTQATEAIRVKFDRVALIDADFIKYLTCNDISNYIKQNGHHPRDKFGNGYLHKFVDEQLDKQFFKRFEAKGYIFLFSGNSKDTFRYSLSFSKEYKGNRSTSDDTYEGFYSDLAQVMGIVAKRHTVYVHPKFEADDIVSYLQNDDTFIYSRDKDLKQVPGFHYNVSTNMLDRLDKAYCENQLYMQMLMGDNIDNITGVEGVGQKTAAKILNGIAISNQLQVVIDAYISKYGDIEGMDRFSETWMMVKMRFDRGGYEKSNTMAPAIKLRNILTNN